MSAKQRNWETIGYNILSYVAIIFLLTSIVIPFLFVILGSFKPSSELFGAPHLLPHNATFDSWTQGFARLKPFLINSAISALGTGILSLVLTIEPVQETPTS